jgi:hypothetical protein
LRRKYFLVIGKSTNSHVILNPSIGKKRFEPQLVLVRCKFYFECMAFSLTRRAYEELRESVKVARCCVIAGLSMLTLPCVVRNI